MKNVIVVCLVILIQCLSRQAKAVEELPLNQHKVGEWASYRCEEFHDGAAWSKYTSKHVLASTTDNDCVLDIIASTIGLGGKAAENKRSVTCTPKTYPVLSSEFGIMPDECSNYTWEATGNGVEKDLVAGKRCKWVIYQVGYKDDHASRKTLVKVWTNADVPLTGTVRLEQVTKFGANEVRRVYTLTESGTK